MEYIRNLAKKIVYEFSFYLSGFWGGADKLLLSVFNLNLHIL